MHKNPKEKFYDLTQGLSQLETARILEGYPNARGKWLRDFQIRLAWVDIAVKLSSTERQQRHQERVALLTH
jgi:hypothetical protein